MLIGGVNQSALAIFWLDMKFRDGARCKLTAALMKSRRKRVWRKEVELDRF